MSNIRRPHVFINPSKTVKILSYDYVKYNQKDIRNRYHVHRYFEPPIESILFIQFKNGDYQFLYYNCIYHMSRNNKFTKIYKLIDLKDYTEIYNLICTGDESNFIIAKEIAKSNVKLIRKLGDNDRLFN